jgi:hypothetical protein
MKRYASWLAPVVAVVAAFAVIPWLRQQDTAVASALAVAAGIAVMGYVLLITYRRQRRLDEVQLASQGFAHTHGWVGATFATALLLMVPPIMNGLVDLANVWSAGSPDIADRSAMRRAILVGFALAVFMQTIGGLVAAAVWWRRMRRIGEQA